jgi:hypothetical protein
LEQEGKHMTIRKTLLGTVAAILMISGPAVAGDYTPATAPNTPQEALMLAAAMAFATEHHCPFVQINKMAVATTLLDGHVDIIGKDKQLFLDHVDWAKSAVEYALLKGTPTTADFCANAWKTMGPGSPMPLLERIAQ